MKQRDEYGRLYVNGAPPNYRIVKSCGTCSHSFVGYDGYIGCSKWRVRWDAGSEDGDSQGMEVSHGALCDAHEPQKPRSET